MSADFFHITLAAAAANLAKSEGHLENYFKVRSFDPWDASFEYLFACEEVRIAKLKIQDAAADLAAEMARSRHAKKGRA